MMQPYTYVITWYPGVDNPGKEPRILHHGLLMADSQLSAFSQMLTIAKPGNDYDPEEIEFMAKPFLDGTGCDTKKSLSNDFYQFLLNDTTWAVKNNTGGWNDHGFQSYNYEKPKVPNAMMMIDVMALLNNDKTL